MNRITPKPNHQELHSRTCEISNLTGLVIRCPFEKESAYLLEKLSGLGLSLTQASDTGETDGAIILEQARSQKVSHEGYTLKVNPSCISICASEAQGAFYGIQTLRQILAVDASEELPKEIPCMTIEDHPRFGWRGFMLDESRHFFGKDYVKKILDWMALLKMNRFHWHLTDEPAWRLEIKRYPKLTEIGSKGSWSDPDAPQAFYTQDDIREIVAYAAERHIVIVPEIDMPGHATAANRAYPEYSGGGSERCPDFTFNPGKEETYTYLQDILSEAMDLFPGQWIHFGADEVHFGNEQWNHDPDVQALMKRENLDDLKQVEHYFIRRIAAFLVAHGRTAIGWDEMACFDIPTDGLATMWWRHDLPEVLAQAYAKGLSTILCPRLPCYFDFVQHESHKCGRRWAEEGFGAVEELYAYPPDNQMPAEASDSLLGIQGNLWTERVQNAERADFMTFPRLIALAEAAWTNTDNKDIDDFKQRLPRFFSLMNAQGTAYFNPLDSNSTPEVAGVEKKTGENKLEEEIQAEQ